MSSLWLDKLTDERTAKWESVLLGNPETVEAARIWQRRVGQGCSPE